jgi:putative transposase
VDWGVKETATTTDDAYDLPHAEHGRRAAQRLARYQRMMARRRPSKGQPASAGYRKAQAQAAKLHKKIARQREDTARKWAKRVMRGHDRVAVEDFRPKFLAKTTLARKAADAAIAATKRALVEMGRKHGRDVRVVHPAHTTMDCAVRSENQARTASVDENVYLHRVWSRVPQGQELRPRDAGPGRLEPGRCRGRKTTRAAGSGGGLSRKSPLSPGGAPIPSLQGGEPSNAA